MSKRLRVVIDRAKHLNGAILKRHPKLDSFLLSSQPLTKGMMCCLGFACLAAGVPKENLEDVSMPDSDVCNMTPETASILHKFGLLGKPVEDLSHMASDAAYTLASYNDNRDISNETREKAIIKRGKLLGIDFVFTGKYPKD